MQIRLSISTPGDHGVTSTAMRFVRITLVMIVAAVAVAPAQQRPELSAAVRAYVKVDAAVVALTHVRVIDGTGAAPVPSITRTCVRAMTGASTLT